MDNSRPIYQANSINQLTFGPLSKSQLMMIKRNIQGLNLKAGEVTYVRMGMEGFGVGKGD